MTGKKQQSAPETEVTPLVYELVIEVNNEPRKILMSYGLLSQLAILVDSPENVAMIGLQPRLARELCAVVLIPRSDEGDILMKTEHEMNQILDQITIEDFHKLINWVQEHLVDFFMKGVKTTTAVMSRLKLDQQDESSTSS